jgi:hypothetical protein
MRASRVVAVYDEGLVVARHDATVKPTVDVFAQGLAGGAELFQQGKHSGGFQLPAVFAQVGLGQVKLVVCKDLDEFLDGALSYPVHRGDGVAVGCGSAG